MSLRDLNFDLGETIDMLRDSVRAFAAAEIAPDGTLQVDFDGVRRSCVWVRQGGDINIFDAGGSHRIALVDPLADASAEEGGGGRVTAPMPGRVNALLVEPGAAVARGQPRVVLEAMKMEHTIKAPQAGTVQTLRYAVGDQVEDGALLVEFAEEPS